MPILLLACPLVAQDPARALADLLAQKGVITAGELERVRRASPDEAVRLLAAVLRQKGVLTDAESARFTPPAAAAAPVVSAAVRPPAPPAATKAESTAPAPLNFYGIVLLNSFYNTGANNNQDLPLTASKRSPDGAGSFGMSARSSRLGARFQGPMVAGAKLSGQLEFDLNGGKVPVGNGISMDLFRLRLAFGRLDWKHVSLVAGQDWSVFAPLNPTSLGEYGVPGLSASGNAWIRTPQLRAEVRSGALLWQVAATDPDMGDNSTSTVVALRQPGTGERGRMPAIDNRLALGGHIGGREASAGLSAHYGRGRNIGTVAGLSVMRPVDSWGVALDYTLPVMAHLSFTGEAFTGRALGIFSSASGESVLPPGTAGEHGVESRGGWVQAQINWTARWQSNIAWGLETMNAAQLRTGDRARNQTVFTNLMFKPSPRVTFAWEWRRFVTGYVNQPAANNTGDHLNLGVAYTF